MADRAVLVVTDDPLLTEEATYAFPADVRVEIARDARQAIETMRDYVPSVVVVDIQTGSAGGYALARDMNDDERLRGVPIMMLLERADDRWLAAQAGAARADVKPVGSDRLVRAALGLLN